MIRKSLILLVICASLTACADRERLNCPRTKNKALRGAVIGPVITPTTTATQYGTGGKCV
jgi:hypothetical protein